MLLGVVCLMAAVQESAASTPPPAQDPAAQPAAAPTTPETKSFLDGSVWERLSFDAAGRLRGESTFDQPSGEDRHRGRLRLRLGAKYRVTETVTAMSEVFRERAVRLELRMPDTVSPVYADADRVKQVLLNLLSNAAKFCEPTRGRVEVSLQEEGSAVRVSVRDNGPGISAADQRIIFEKFRQVGDALTDKPQGTGLGLHICRQIVERLGGRLWVESRPGAGACFSFTLPVPPEREGA